MKAVKMKCVTVEDVLRLREHAIATEKERDKLREALAKIDADLEGRNFLESSSLRDTARAALKATEEGG